MIRKQYFVMAVLLLLLVACGANTIPAPAGEQSTADPIASPSLLEETEEGPTGETTSESYPAPTQADDSTTGAYPAPVDPNSTTAEGYPAPQEELARVPAETAYPLAAEEAHQWNDEAIFVGIVPALQMFRNLNIPPLRNGWFFKFVAADSEDEFYALIRDGTVSGTTVAQPILLEPLPYAEEEIELDQLSISSDDFRQRFLESEAGAPYRDDESGVDYRLVDLDSSPNPVWSALDGESGEELFHIDAVTGERTGSPFPSSD